MSSHLVIPADLLPRDGRFGSGPSKVRDAQLEALARAQPGLLGTSHRAAPVKSLVGDVRSMVAELFQAPAGYEVVLGLGGSTAFWDSAAFSLVAAKAQHCAFGEFGAKFAAVTSEAPHLAASSVIEAPAGTICRPVAEDGVDVYAWTHNETSTGAAAPVRRPAGIGDALVVVDATSAAAGMRVDLGETDVYYFAPQKGFASDGGLWLGLFSPAALARVEEVAASGRYIPATLSLAAAVENSRANQTLNTPAVATLVMMRAQVEWLLAQGGLEFGASRCDASAAAIYEWAEASDFAAPFVADPLERSPVVATVDLADSVPSESVREVLRANGVVDVDPYRKLGRNQLRVGMYPAVDPEDVAALTRCVDWVVGRLGERGAAGAGG